MNREMFSSFAKSLAEGGAALTTFALPDGSLKVEPGEMEGGTTTRFAHPAHLVLFGGGHVGQALAAMADVLGMEVTVVDDREEVLTRKRFPKAELIHSPFTDLPGERLSKIANPYFCVFTHGHGFDSECLAWCCQRPSAYVGMIGSRRKIEACFRKAEAAGIPREVLEKVHSPIGLSINAVTPGEIAVSILAEIISVSRKDKATVVVDPEFVERALGAGPGTLARIIRADGSSPGKTGAMMFVPDDGKPIGTVGGGALENRAIEEAGKTSSPRWMKFELTGKGELGMECGGDALLGFSRF